MTTPSSRSDQLDLGIDLGSVSVKAVLIDDKDGIVEHHYIRHRGQPVRATRGVLADMLERFPAERIRRVAVTGAGGKLLAELLDAYCVNEVVAQAAAAAVLHPDARTIIEIGGEDSKLVFLQPGDDGKPAIADFAMNTICAAGTGSFLDQQAHRLGLSIEEFGELALRSEHPPRLAGRCSVFAKSDMIHLQQKATPSHDIVAGLSFAMARNFKSTVSSARTLDPPVYFHGGVAANPGIVRAFHDVLELSDDELRVPEHFAVMGAIGAVHAARGDGAPANGFAGFARMDTFLAGEGERPQTAALDPLRPALDMVRYEQAEMAPAPGPGERIPAYLGVDVGSISTNLVVLDTNKRVIAKRYLMTAGAPIEAVRRGLREIGAEVGDRVEIRGVCTTGSGRYLTGDFVGADIVKNEITAQARGAIEIDPRVDTIFEIGGQDSKFISLDNTAIVDFEMNKVCAAGTGSFLEEQAEKLGIKIEEQFGDMALSATAPPNLGERCTVFMESELVRHQQTGTPTEDLVAGLSYSIVYNYLNRVVAGKRVGNRIFFQGGVAANRAVAAAFAKVTGKSITVPAHYEVTGAIGCALLAMENDTGTGSRFRGFDLSERKYEITSFECKDCPNRCEVNRVTVEREQPRFYGSRCEKYDVERRVGKGEGLPDLFAERTEFLLNAYTPSEELPEDAPRVGIPRSLLFHEVFPLWHAFFTELGCRVVLSDPTTKRIIHRGVEGSIVETCFPMKVALGHVLDLLDKGVDYLFLPSVINLPREEEEMTDSFVCPYVQSFPYTVRSAVDLEAAGVKVLQPATYMYLGPEHIYRVLGGMASTYLGKDRQTIAGALNAGLIAWDKFQQSCRERGEEVLASLDDHQKAVVVISRSYNGCDPGANLELPRKLRDLGILPIPMDFLPLDSVRLAEDWPNMYWRYGQKILAAAEIVADDPRLTSLYITNFGCGPDSFITKYFRKRMGDKPYLQIEVDEHSADAGMITRCEAFLDSLAASDGREIANGHRLRWFTIAPGSKRTVLLPYMADHAYGLAAAFEASGMPAEVLPESDQETLSWGRQYTSGKECYPCIITTGDMVKRAMQPDFDRDKYAFFMGGSGGPCRFGQYSALQRMVLDEIGFEDVPMYAPNQASSFWNDLGMIGRKFLRVGWQAIVAIDVLSKALWETRPYEVEPGATERVYRQHLDAVCDAIRNDQPLDPVMREARRAFDKIRVDRSEPRPVIGVVGEIFVRAHRFSNNYVADEIQALGGEVWMAPVYEWFLYRNFRRSMRSWLDNDLKLWTKNLLMDWVMRRDEHRLVSPFHGYLRNAEEPPTREVLGLSGPYLHRTFEGEAILTVGKAIDFVRKGAAGVVSTMPFTCMPGTIAHAIIKRVKEEEGGFPFLNMVYDGTEQASEDTRIEAFMHQAREYARRKGAPKGRRH
ncbi:MAG: CoA activase [Armatimonadota bacterium]|nr:MAG: CoA activase [Armatimonadota bacterium]